MTGMYLEHYGVLGMKWGIRRYQNADGTLTAAGKKRYAGATKEQIETSERRKAKVIKGAKTAAKIGGKVALSAVFAIGLKEVSAATGITSAGAKAISSVLNIQDGPTYRDIKSIKAQNFERYLRTGRINEGYPLKSIAAQKFDQDLRREMAKRK